MREYIWSSTTHGLVALALASGFLLPCNHLAARTVPGAEPLTGLAQVIDGDTIAINDTRVRLEGIDAPEAGQTCKRKWFGSWPCGAAATDALLAMLQGKSVSCEPRGLDKYGRTLAVCFIDGRDINAAMVRQGFAWAFVKYSTSYVAEEAEARAQSLGIWQGPSMPAWEYRAQRWTAASPQAPQGCAIKGNVTRNGRIYHMPWSPWYAQIRIEPDKGKRWFCTEAEALAAGWRPVQAH
ncbi:MAG TPA: thermonuclease family protein [Hyphomicrobiaceae bacterium]|nr:thermonuclease family protein [Hyphomicrobiaceae bacterium]